MWLPKIKNDTFYDAKKLINVKSLLTSESSNLQPQNFPFSFFFFKIANLHSHFLYKNDFLTICMKFRQTKQFRDRILLNFRQFLLEVRSTSKFAKIKGAAHAFEKSSKKIFTLKFMHARCTRLRNDRPNERYTFDTYPTQMVCESSNNS